MMRNHQNGIVRQCWNEIYLTVTNVRATVGDNANSHNWPMIEDCRGPSGSSLVGAFADLYEQIAAECGEQTNAEGNSPGFGEECEYLLRMDVLGNLVHLATTSDCPRGLLSMTVGLMAGLCRHCPPALLIQDGVARALSTLLKLLVGVKPSAQAKDKTMIVDKMESTIGELLFGLVRQLSHYHPLALAIDYPALVDLLMSRIDERAELIMRLLSVKEESIQQPFLQVDLPLKLCTHFLTLPHPMAEGWLQFCDQVCLNLQESHVMVGPWKQVVTLLASKGFTEWRPMLEECQSPELVIPMVQQWQRQEPEDWLEDALTMACLFNHPVNVTGLFKQSKWSAKLWKSSHSVHLRQCDQLFRLFARLPWQLQGGGSREECSLLYGRHLSLAEAMVPEHEYRPWHQVENPFEERILTSLSKWWSNPVSLNFNLTEYCLQWASCPDPQLIYLHLLPKLSPILETLVKEAPELVNPDDLLIATQKLLADPHLSPFDPQLASHYWLLGHLVWQLAAHLQVHACRSYCQLIYE